MAGVRRKPIRGGKYQGWFIQADGKRKYFTGTHSRAETLRIAERLEDEHRQVRLGYRPAPSSAAKHCRRPFSEVRKEYMAWGESQGGRRGKPWGSTHARNRRSHLEWWEENLALEHLGDLDGILPRVEQVLRTLQAQGRSGKTLGNYAESLGALCRWCIRRGYLDTDPLKSLARFDTTPRTKRRAMTPEEIVRLLEACAPHRRLLFETAFLSGLRVKELLNLTLAHLDLERSGLGLDDAWTKNRMSGFQPLPRDLLERLKVFSESGEPAQLYKRFYRRRDATLTAPARPLLYVPSHPARDLDKGLEKAQIPKHTPDGKLDFHACRVAYITFVVESGATLKEAQTLARHSTPQLTMNVYARARDERLSEAVEKIADRLNPEKRVTCVQQPEEGAETKSATPINNKELRLTENGGGGGN